MREKIGKIVVAEAAKGVYEAPLVRYTDFLGSFAVIPDYNRVQFKATTSE